MKRGKIILAAAASVIIALAVFFIFWQIKNNNKPIDTSTWSIYQNNNPYFTFKYPGKIVEYKLSEGRDAGVDVLLPGIDSDDVSEKILQIFYAPSDYNVQEEVNIIQNQHNLNKYSASQINVLDYSVGGVGGKQILYSFTNPNLERSTILVSHNNFMFRFSLSWKPKNERDTKRLMNLVLSTFKFAK